jgi:xylulokinase
MHGAVLLDASGEVVRPALIWCDQRTEKQSLELSAKFGRERLIQLTCNPPLTNFTLTKLLWVRENEPQLWARVRYVMLPKDYVRFRLTGDRAIDQADASGTLLLDVAKRAWSKEVLSATGIDESFLPKLYESPDVCGKLCEAGRGGHRFESRHAGGCGSGRPGGRRGGDGNCASRSGERDNRHFGRGVCGDRPAGARSARTAAYVLSRDSRPLARDGRDAGSGSFAAVVSRHLRRREEPSGGG